VGDHRRRARRRRPGICGLLELLDEHGEAVEADLLRYYGVDILDLGHRRLTWGRLRRLLERLPRESNLVRETVGERAAWGDSEHLLAMAVDMLHVANWQRGH